MEFAPGGDLNSRINYAEPLVMRKRRSFTGGAAGDEKIYTGLDLPGDQIAQGGFVNGAVLLKRRYQSCAASPQLHNIKITLISTGRKYVSVAPL